MQTDLFPSQLHNYWCKKDYMDTSFINATKDRQVSLQIRKISHAKQAEWDAQNNHLGLDLHLLQVILPPVKIKRIDCFYYQNFNNHTLTMHFKALQIWKQLKQFFPASLLDANTSVHIKRCNAVRTWLWECHQTFICHANYSEQAQKFKRGATLCNGYNPLISHTYTPSQIEGNKVLAFWNTLKSLIWKILGTTEIQKRETCQKAYFPISFICETRHCIEIQTLKG